MPGPRPFPMKLFAGSSISMSELLCILILIFDFGWKTNGWRRIVGLLYSKEGKESEREAIGLSILI